MTHRPLCYPQPVDYGTNTWQALIEVRRRNAIGIFEWKLHKVRADDAETARHWMLKDAHMYGYETRGLRDLKRIV